MANVDVGGAKKRGDCAAFVELVPLLVRGCADCQADAVGTDKTNTLAATSVIMQTRPIDGNDLCCDITVVGCLDCGVCCCIGLSSMVQISGRSCEIMVNCTVYCS